MNKGFLKLIAILVLVLSLFILTACDSEDEEDDKITNKDKTITKVLKNEEDDKLKFDKSKKNEENVLLENISEEIDETSKNDMISEKEALELIKKYYDIAESLYFLSDEYFDINLDENGEEYVSKYPINNYEEVINKYISKKYQREFYPALLIKENGKYYIGIGGFAEGYDNLRFEKVEIEENKISCKVILDLYVVDEVLGKDLEADFALVKENGDWKIDDYTSFNSLNY